MSVDINDLDSGGEYFIKTKTTKKFEARIVLSVVGAGEVLALTPAGDVALEDLAARGTKTFIRVDRNRPLGVPPSAIDFDDFPDPNELDELYAKADQDRDELLGEREEARKAAGAPESRFGYKRRPEGQDAGKLVAGDGVPAGDPSLGKRPGPSLSGGLGALSQALKGHDAAVVLPAIDIDNDAKDEDVRTLPVKYDKQGQRWREFREGADEVSNIVFADWPISGPQTTGWVLKWIKNRSGTPMAWHAAWKAAGRLQETDGQVAIHESACRVLETALCYDQINAGSLACLELVARQLQIAEDKLSHRFLDVDGEQGQADYCLMSGASHKSQLCIAPSLKQWIAGEMQKDAAVLKERRKAREERVLAHPKKKGKDGGKGE